MQVTSELRLTEFKFWSGAKDHSFTYSELQNLECQIEDLFCDKQPTETEINDLFWFEDEQLCSWLGLDYDEYLER